MRRKLPPRAPVRLYIVLAVFLMAIAVSIPLVQPADYKVGVKIGDWTKYSHKIAWSPIGNGTEPSYITDAKKIDWSRCDVENVSGAVVTFNLTAHYSNGTQTSLTFDENVTTGFSASGMSFGFILPFIAANLTQGDPLVTRLGATIVNQTTTGIYASANRNVNFLERTWSIDNLTATNRVYWDRETGVLVEGYEDIPAYSTLEATPGDQVVTGYEESSLKVIETNMWSADLIGTILSNFDVIITGVLVAIAIIVTILVLRRKRKTLPPPKVQNSAGSFLLFDYLSSCARVE
jgi:hypothetical protein